MYKHLYAKLVYPLYHRLTGSGVVMASRELESHNKLTCDQLRAVEKRRLCKLLAYAQKNVPYYRQIIDQSGKDVDTLAELQHFKALPLLSKSIIRQQGDRLHSENMAGNQLDPNSTSGSTGSPMQFFTDHRSKRYRRAVVNRNRKWLGIEIGDPVIRLWGSPIDQKTAEAFRGRLHAKITRETFLSAYEIGDDNFAGYARVIQRNKARLLIGYPSVLSEFAAFCGDHSIRFPSLHAIISSAEALNRHYRMTIEENLCTPLFNRYGCREVGDIAQEVPGQKGLIINSDRILVEIIDDYGEPCSPGVLGRIIVTDLDNLGMPFIRYDIGDMGCLACSDSHDSVLPYPVLATLEGRSLDIVRSPNGSRVGGTFWTILFRERPGIARFQVVQDTVAGVNVRYQKDRSANQLDFDYFSGKIRNVLGADFEVSYEKVDKIHPDANGKYRIVISRQVQASKKQDDD